MVWPSDRSGESRLCNAEPLIGRKDNMDELHDCERSMELAKKLIVCKKCGAKNPEHASQCNSCASALRSPPAADSSAIREAPPSYGPVDSADGYGTNGRKSIWHTKYRNRVALNLFLVALFAFILVTYLLSGASSFNIAVVVIFLALSTTRFLYTWRSIQRELNHA
jgi:ribosomal protein L40E